MPGSSKNDRLRPSFWDRLTLAPQDVTSEALRIDARQLVTSVRRDVEKLLNTRRNDLLAIERLPEASSSLLTYGLPDLAMYSGSSSRDRRHICELITEILRRFEPRLLPSTIRVEYVEGGQSVGTVGASSARFRIRGTLHIEPLRQPVTFDTDVDMETSEVHLEDADDA